MPEWPLGNRAALSLSFDNLGEAAEVQLGARPMPEGPIGGHFTATETMPKILAALTSRFLKATFFVEGINSDLYLDLLLTLSLRGHEVGYHAWRHEDWAGLSAAEQADNLARGLAAFARLGLGTTGMRPPGGLLGEGGLEAIRDAGLAYCSPAGQGLSQGDGLAVVPFEWRHVDAVCVLPPLASVRQRMAGSPEPIEPAEFVEYISAEVDRLLAEGRSPERRPAPVHGRAVAGARPARRAARPDRGGGEARGRLGRPLRRGRRARPRQPRAIRGGHRLRRGELVGRGGLKASCTTQPGLAPPAAGKARASARAISRLRAR